MEVEVVLAGHPDVAVVAVAGVPDPRRTEVPAAFVELLGPTPSARRPDVPNGTPAHHGAPNGTPAARAAADR